MKKLLLFCCGLLFLLFAGPPAHGQQAAPPAQPAPFVFTPATMISVNAL